MLINFDGIIIFGELGGLGPYIPLTKVETK